MATIEELKGLYQQAKYRELIGAVDVAGLRPDSEDDERKLLQVGWAHHQLGEYLKSVAIFVSMSKRHSADTEIGESALRGWAHGVLQWTGDIAKADEIMRGIYPSLGRDNVRMNLFITAARKGLRIPVIEVMDIIINALARVPHTTVSGHIINNGALTFHEARAQEDVKPYLPILPGLMLTAIGIYERTNTSKNHIAAAEYRASLICEAARWRKNALLCAQTAVELWHELVSSQDGARFQNNLEGAQAQLNKLEQDQGLPID